MPGPTHSPNDIPTQPHGRSSNILGKLLVLRGPQAGKAFELSAGANIFGREVGHIIRDVRVSRQHAKIQEINGELILVDTQSTNGTFVNGQLVDGSTVLEHGDTIRMGDTILSLKIEGQGLSDPAIIGARTPDLTGENDSGATILAKRDSLEFPTQTNAPRIGDTKETDNIENTDPEDQE
jgi:pSer/pThr/pTyr-binding forkhead associated (FHA) protein